MATKQSTIFSTNPKMDTSGISAKAPQYGYMGQPLKPKDVAGGKLFLEAVDECESGKSKANALSTPENMKKAASYVNQGLSVDHAFDVVSRETLNMPDKVDVIKTAAKLLGGKRKGY